MAIHHRWALLPTQLQQLTQIRLASTASSSTSNPFPFPEHPRPTPHEIFHLPYNASQEEIKLRYYDLVRAHHPDSSSCRLLDPQVRHARFQAITAAYDKLRRDRSAGFGLGGAFDYEYAEEVARRKHMYYKHYHARKMREEQMAPKYTYARYDWNSNPDDRWKDYAIIGFGVFAICIGVAPGLFLFPLHIHKRHEAAVFNLSQARSEAKLVGEDRMREMKSRAKELKSRDNSSKDS
ncbi:hypothetical protein Moror_8015 [Moniliophthora roreri MCA 2997]|uniref:J domain-containing protein n=2 Tax=Moniliophthora roreri TaxID=221103 RepID=V2X5X2_MONRO|nr:hypothetical protein Moror_8015 [Moniliophthora roreri MCA 2997]KAI3610670.1 hypothetical protein WG66_006912 [Moniliophthora roreri]